MKPIRSTRGFVLRALQLVKPVAACVTALTFTSAAFSQSARILVVAAENFYGDVVHQLGGSHVDVTSVLSDPNQDPHLFEASPKTAKPSSTHASSSIRR